MRDVQKEVDMQDDVTLRAVEQIPSLEERTLFRWPRFLLESVLAIGGALVVTGLISLFHLYPQIPNISLVYLLVILLLASTFGRYAAVLASITSFLAFYFATLGPVTILRFLPLRTDQRVFGVLCLRIQHPAPWFADVAHMEHDRTRPGSRVAFFWTYLEQVNTLIERALLRSTATL
jgi:Domain of unknown function (DUF4118)